MPSRTGQRSRVRHAISGQELLVGKGVALEKGRRWSGSGRGSEGCRRNGHGPGTGPCPDAANGCGAGFPGCRPGPGSREVLGMHRHPGFTQLRRAICARLDGRRRQDRPEMDGGQEPVGSAEAGDMGFSKELSQSRRCEGNPLSRPPLERRMGHSALPPQRFGAFALLDAQTGIRATDTVLHGHARFRSAASRLPRRGWGETGLPTRRNAVLRRQHGRIARSPATAILAIRWRERPAPANPA